jgi:hypothetical protein
MKTGVCKNWVKQLSVLFAFAAMAVSIHSQVILTWNGGDGNWTDTNWLNGASTVAFTNNPTTTINVDYSGNIITVNSGGPLRIGQIITGSNFAAVQVQSDLGGGQYQVSAATASPVTSATAYANTEVGVKFNTPGNVQLSGNQYVSSMSVTSFAASNTLTISKDLVNGGTLHFAPLNGGDGINVNSAGDVEIQVDLTNVGINTNNNLNIVNNGTGELILNGITISSVDGDKFTNAVGSVTAFKNVTFDVAAANGRYLQLLRGNFTFDGLNTVDSKYGLTNIGGNGATVLTINQNSALLVNQTADLNFAPGTSIVTANISGTLSTKGKVNLGNSSGTAVMNVNDGGWVRNGGDFNISTSTGTAVLNINTGGTVSLTTTTYVNSNTGTGSLNVNDGGLYTTTGAVNIGFGAGAGYVNVNAGGTFNATGNVTVGYGAGLGQLSIQGSGSLSNTLTTGYGSGTGVLNVSGNGYLYLGNGANLSVNNSIGTTLMTIQDSGTVISRNNFSIGTAKGLATVNVKGNGSLDTQNAANIIVSSNSGTGVLNISGNGRVIGGDLIVGGGGGNGAGIVNISENGSAILGSNRYLYINQNNSKDGSSGILNLMSGTLQTNGVVFGSTTATVGSNTAQFNMSGGTLILLNNSGFHTGAYNSPVTENDPTHTASNTQINLGGGTIISKASWTSNMNMTLTGSNGNIKFKSINDASVAQTVTLNGVLSGSGGLEVTAGTLLLNGVNTYKGQTIVSAGTLTLGNSASLTISLANLNGLAAFDGTPSGTLNLNGTVSIDLGAFTGDYQLVGTNLLGHVNYSNNNWLSGFTKSGNIWTDANGNTFNSTTGVLQVIPEPSTYLLLTTGVVVVFGLRRWRSRVRG